MSMEGEMPIKEDQWAGGQLGLNPAGTPLRNPEEYTVELSHPPSKEAGGICLPSPIPRWLKVTLGALTLWPFWSPRTHSQSCSYPLQAQEQHGSLARGHP